jgi:2'-5' RNA ligase
VSEATWPQRTLSIMSATDPVSAIVVRVALPEALANIRRRHDPVAAKGVPAHVTLLFPFIPVANLRPAIRSALASIAASVAPFDVRFADVGRFPGVLYLAPEPAGPFRALTASIVSRFPDFPPYAGAHADVVPHLTLTDSPTAPLDAVAGAARHWLPFSRRVAALELLAEDGAGHWTRHWRIALGSSAVATGQWPEVRR